MHLGLFLIEEQLEQNNSPPTLGCDQGQGGKGPPVCQRSLTVACRQDVTLTGHIYDWRRVNTSTWSFLSSSLYSSISSFPSILFSISPLFSFTYTLSFLPPLLLLYQPECQLLLKSRFLLSPTPSFWCISFLSHPPFYIQLLQRIVMQRLTRFSSKVGTADYRKGSLSSDFFISLNVRNWFCTKCLILFFLGKNTLTLMCSTFFTANCSENCSNLRSGSLSHSHTRTHTSHASSQPVIPHHETELACAGSLITLWQNKAEQV